MRPPANRNISDRVLLIALLNVFIARATSQLLPSTITLSPDPNRAEIGSSLTITCSTTGVYSMSELRSAQLLRRFDLILVEVSSSGQITTNNRVNSAPISFEIEQTTITAVKFTIHNVTLSDNTSSPIRCKATFERQNTEYEYSSERKFFAMVGPVGVPTITLSQPVFTEGEYMPSVTCSANVGYPLEFASLTLIHLSSNGSQLDDVRVAESRKTISQHSDGIYYMEQTYDIGCSGGVCSRLSKTNHGDWLVCTAHNPNSTTIRSATSRQQLRVQYRMSTIRILDGEGQVLPGLGDRKPPAIMGPEVIDVVAYTPSNTALRFLCKPDGEPSASVVWFSTGNKLAHILPSPNSSVLTLDLTSKTGSDSFECLAVQHFPGLDPIRRKVVLSLNITTRFTEPIPTGANVPAAIAIASYDNRLLIILLSGGVLAVAITGFVSVCCLRRILCRSSNRATSRRARSPKKVEGDTQNCTSPNVTGNGFDTGNDGLDLALNVQLDDKPRSRKPIVEVEDGLKQYPYSPQDSNFYTVNATSGDVNGNTVSPTTTIITPSILQYPMRAPFVSADNL